MTTTGAAAQEATRRRPTCPTCARPARVCLCHALPAAPHPLSGRVIVLQHPHEAGRRKATAPLLPACVRPVAVCVGRRFDESKKKCPPILMEALADAAAGTVPLFVLWPAAPDAVDVIEVVVDSSSRNNNRPAYTLLAFDGTWRQAREMVAAARATWLGRGGGDASTTALPPGVTFVRVGSAAAAAAPASAAPPPGALFVEPDDDGVSTAEAVSAALETLEPPGAPGPRAISVAVTAMAAVAAQFDPAVAARLGLAEKWGRGVETESREQNAPGTHR